MADLCQKSQLWSDGYYDYGSAQNIQLNGRPYTVTGMYSIGTYLFASRRFMRCFGRLGNYLEVGLLANAELAEDKIQNVLGCRGAGEGVECL